jgi:hypothetical protein
LLLNQLFTPKKLFEGGNLSTSTPGWMGVAGDHEANEIELKIHNRSLMVGILDKLLSNIDHAYSAQFKSPLWNPKLLKSKSFLSGSSLHFFNVKGISDDEFTAKKPKVGDIDTQVDATLEPNLEQFFKSITGKQVGNAVFLGYKYGNNQFTSLWELKELPIKVQIDFEFGKYDPKTQAPDAWFAYSHSSEWNDVEAGIKGVFHKYLNRALAAISSSEKYVARVLKKGVKISPEPATDNDLSFAVSGPGGGGMSRKYVPYVDPSTGEPMMQNGIPVMRLLEPKDRDYIQNLDQQFSLIYNRKPAKQDKELMKSFLGTLDLMNKYLNDQQRETVANNFLDICFGTGAQMLTKDDPSRDRETKFAAVDNIVEKLKISNAQGFRQNAIQMAKAYEDSFRAKKQPAGALNEDAMIGKIEQTGKIVRILKKQHTVPFSEEKNWLLIDTDPAKGNNGVGLKWVPASTRFEWVRPYKDTLAEAEVQAQLRKGMPHLHDLKAPDFLDLLDEIHDGNGRFKLENIPLNVKIDGFGGRFGKNADGQPFMGTSRTPPRYQASFLKHHQDKGTTDPEILGRAKMFDDLFKEMMNAIKLVDNKLGSDFLMNKQVTCEVLFLPFATETPEGRLKFVGIHYDKLPEGVQLALVPFHAVEADTGEPVKDPKFIDELLGVGNQGSVMFINNKLTQNEGLDVTEIINVLDNIDELKQIVSDTAGKRDRVSMQLKKSVEEQLQPIKEKLEQAIIKDPNIIGKDMLGKDYEGIVINSRLGPIKITSQEQRDVISAKLDAKKNAYIERPRENSNKTAVVAIGSFIGHKGHEELFNYTINKAKEVGGDPYLFIGNAEGKDDPIPPAVKVQTWHKLYPQYANNISTVSHQGGTLIQKIKHELINPLPGKSPRYDNIIIMVGEDRAGMNMPAALMKAVNKFQGYEHVKVELGVTPRGTGISGTALRNSLKKDPPEKALATWSNAFDVKKLGVDWIKHLMDITRKGMGIEQKQPEPEQQPQPVPVAERLLNALIRTQVNESTSVDSALKIIINDIGEPITGVYDKLKFMAKRYVHDHGELNRGWKMVEMGEGARWVQNMYNAQLKGALYALTKYNPKRTGDLTEFLAGREVNGEIEMKRSFNNISSELPEILAKVGNYIESPELTKAARRWMQNKNDYENYLNGLEDDGDDYNTASKPEKSKLPGQQNAQADQIVNDILKKLPNKVAGDIRNAIARTPNKLQSLQAELQKRGVSVPMAESIIETARMSAAARLQKALQREKEKSDYSRRYAEKHFPIGKPKEEPKKNQSATNTNESDKDCPPATQDISLNLKNRQKAINEYGYGPLNPDMPNRKFWMKKVDEWNLDSVEEAKSSLCGNCAAFDQRSKTLDCIAQGIGSDAGENDPTIEAGDLGYCRFLKFKCASRRTCDAWVTGGPLTDEQNMSEGLGKHIAGAALAGAMALGGGGAHAQSGEDLLPDIVAHVTFKVNGNTVTKNINLGTNFKSPGEASAALEKFMRSKGIKYFEYDLERKASKDSDYIEKTPVSDIGSGSMDSSPAKATSAGGDYMAKEDIPQPGQSSGKAKEFNPNAKIQTKEMTLDQILTTVKGIPYVNNVVDDWDAKDYSWGVTKKVIEYAQYLQKNPQSVANLPPLVVIDGKLDDGAHRLSAINLLQKRMDPKNPVWKQVKLKVNFGTSADVAEAGSPAQQAAIAISKKEKQNNEDQRLDPHCWKGYRKQGTKMKGGTRVNNCVPVREDIEDLMAGYIKLLESK